MDDGKELIEMVCSCYESPDDEADGDLHDFSASLLMMPWSYTHACGQVIMCIHALTRMACETASQT